MFPRFYGEIVFLKKASNFLQVAQIIVDLSKRSEPLLHCRRMRQLLFLIASLFITSSNLAFCQVLGGSSTYNFLKLPSTPQLSALGGINISNRTNDIGMTMSNPAFLRDDMSGQLHASFNSMYAGIKNLALVGGYRV